MTVEIQTEHLFKHYHGQSPDHSALMDFNLSVAQGQLYGLVGPDGAGKTTLLRILATVLSPTSGKATIGNVDVTHKPETVRLRIGYMPQNYSLYPDLSVLENLTFFADLYGVERTQRDERIGKLLDFARLQDFKSRRSEHLSGGMRKKLALACALIHQPQVLLLDEPTTGVDPVSRRELWKLLADVIRQGMTVLVSTPYMDEAERCHQVGMLYRGKLLTTGNPLELEKKYPFAVVEVKASPRKLMRDVTANLKGVISWRPVGDRLRVAVKDGEKFLPKLEKALSTAGAQISLLRTARPSMEDVFINLTEDQREGA